MKPKILLIDIETRPHIVYCWGFFKQNISPAQVLDHGGLMSVAAKWLGGDEIFYEEARDGKDKKLVKKICSWLNEADMIIAHNGERFDMKRIRARALVNNLPPPSPVKVIDTLLIARREFGFSGNSLAYLSDVLKLKTKKGDHKKFPGFSLWVECLKGNEEAWTECKDYNILDILALEELYLRLRPWATQHPNVAIYEENKEDVICPKCGGNHVQFRGFAYTNVGKYQRFQCTSCGGWGRSRHSVLSKNENHITHLVN